MIRIIEILASGVTDDSANVLASGTVTSYLAGTTTLETLYQDFELTVPHANPLTLSASGRAIAFSDSRVKLVFHNSAGSLVRTINNVGTNDSDIPSSAEQAIPAGFVGPYTGNSIPSGWLGCDGSAVSRTTYASLFTAIGTTWGVGDGSTTFTLPDFRGRALIGDGTGSGLTARTLAGLVGAETVTLTAAESGVPAHTHTITDPGHTHTLTDASALRSSSVAGTEFTTGAGNAAGIKTATVVSGSTGITAANSNSTASAASGHANMQPSAVVKWIVKT